MKYCQTFSGIRRFIFFSTRRRKAGSLQRYEVILCTHKKRAYVRSMASILRSRTRKRQRNHPHSIDREVELDMNKGCPISARDFLLVARRREALKQLVYSGLGRAIPFRYSVLRPELAAGDIFRRACGGAV